VRVPRPRQAATTGPKQEFPVSHICQPCNHPVVSPDSDQSQPPESSQLERSPRPPATPWLLGCNATERRLAMSSWALLLGCGSLRFEIERPPVHPPGTVCPAALQECGGRADHTCYADAALVGATHVIGEQQAVFPPACHICGDPLRHPLVKSPASASWRLSGAAGIRSMRDVEMNYRCGCTSYRPEGATTSWVAPLHAQSFHALAGRSHDPFPGRS